MFLSYIEHNILNFSLRLYLYLVNNIFILCKKSISSSGILPVFLKYTILPLISNNIAV